ncbi:hypothetical protein [Corynebacterium urinipleomorphum]|uniref:hypothetical protein n=1 Tax=Corynebacterium urinipleomorphum TaxID=1852380 RepID=UPI00117742BF|nr:hypothetical protein [Corynebacterium urinipleomorphum]
MSTQVSTTDPEKQPRRRVPAAAFIVGFGALLIICLVFAIGVVNYETSASERASSSSSTATGTETTSQQLPAVTTVTGADGQTSVSRPPKPAPPETSEEQVKASIRTQFIADAKTARTYTGVAVTGNITEEALGDFPEFAGHLSRLLEQNCVDSMALTTPDNERVTFNGFCYTTLPGESIQRMLTVALDGKADSIDFANNPGYGNSNYVSITWYVPSEKSAERIHETWNGVRRPRAVEQIRFYTYSPEKVHRLVKERGKADYWRDDEVF